jgi:hypothetical protein
MNRSDKAAFRFVISRITKNKHMQGRRTSKPLRHMDPSFPKIAFLEVKLTPLLLAFVAFLGNRSYQSL